MNDAFRVRGVQSIGNFNGESQQYVRLDGSAGDAVLQGQAVQKLHGDERLVTVFSDFVDGADIRMVQRRSRFRFAPKPLQRPGIPG